MSTLALGTIKSISSAAPVFQNTSGVEKGQLAKAWINFNGKDTVAIRDSFNVSSLTDNSTGNYSMNFSTAMSNANYCVVSSGSESGVGGAARFISGDGNSASAALLLTFNSTTNTDYSFCSFAVFGD